MELSDIRKEIDAVDDRILELFLRRMELAEAVAAYKRERNQPILNKDREKEILDKVTERAGSRAPYARRLFAALMELSRARQAELMGAPHSEA